MPVGGVSGFISTARAGVPSDTSPVRKSACVLTAWELYPGNPGSNPAAPPCCAHQVLKLLREASGNILDDEVLINTLNNSQATSSTINVRVREAEDTERQINAAREVYRPVPIRASILYFVIADLAGIDPMYQYSLGWFLALFGRAMEEAPKVGTPCL